MVGPSAAAQHGRAWVASITATDGTGPTVSRQAAGIAGSGRRPAATSPRLDAARRNRTEGLGGSGPILLQKSLEAFAES